MKILSWQDYCEIKAALTHETEPLAISFVNPFSYYKIKDDLSICDEMNGFFVDGMLLQKLLNSRFALGVQRVSFDYSSIAGDFLSFAQDNKMSVSFLGGTKSEMERFLRHTKNRYPSLEIKSSRHGYFDSDLAADEYINNAAPSDVFLIGMGAPFQDRVAIKLKNSGKCKIAITCGGFITQTSIRDDYYLTFVKKYNLRWLQRFVMHSHVRRRLARDYPRFLVRFISEWIRD